MMVIFFLIIFEIGKLFFIGRRNPLTRSVSRAGPKQFYLLPLVYITFYLCSFNKTKLKKEEKIPKHIILRQLKFGLLYFQKTMITRKEEKEISVASVTKCVLRPPPLNSPNKSWIIIK